MNETSRSALYGRGIFTTIRIVNGEPWLWEKHWRRLQHDAAKLKLDLSSYSEYMVRRGLDESIPDATRTRLQKARITFFDERPAVLWSGERPSVPTRISTLIASLKDAVGPISLGSSSHAINSTSPIAGLKTCNYLEQTLSLDEARSRGLDEAIRINEKDHVASACMANVFWLKGGRLFTPALSTGCLPGTTREFVLENLACEEVEAVLEELKDAEAVFLTSAGLGIVAVDQFNGRRLRNTNHPITRLLEDKE